jgi:predicted peroxiredoxin
MKNFFALLLIPLLAASCIRVDQAPSGYHDRDDDVTDGAFIHVTKGADHEHHVLMALMLADKMSTSNDVLLFFDIDGIEMVVKEAPNLEMDPFDPSDEVFARLLRRGVTILACPGCLEAAGYDEDDLREGVELAEKEDFFDFTEGRILSIDY